MTDEISRYKQLGGLQDLLLKACPPDARGKKSIPAVAKSLEVSHQYVYRWIEDESIPPKFVKQLVEKSNGAVTIEDFHKYVF
jgi:hypothetical protein